MSIPPPLAATPPLQLLELLIAVFGPVVSVAIGLIWKIYRPSTVLGPERLDAGEPATPLLLTLIIGIFAWFSASALYFAFAHPASAEDLPPRDLAIVSVIGGLVPFIAMLIATALLRPHGLRKLGLTVPNLAAALPRALGALVFIFPLVVTVSVMWVSFLDHRHIAHPEKHDLLEVLDKPISRGLKAMIYIAALVVAPLFEELIFRGHLQTLFRTLFSSRSYLTPPASPVVDASPVIDPPPPAAEISTTLPPPLPQRVIPLDSPPIGGLTYSPDPRATMVRTPTPAGIWMAILLTSLLFALVHPWWTQPPIFLLSLALGYLYERTGNLWASILLHFLFNATSVLISLTT